MMHAYKIKKINKLKLKKKRVYPRGTPCCEYADRDTAAIRKTFKK